MNSPSTTSGRITTPTATQLTTPSAINPLLAKQQHLQIEKPKITSTPSSARTTKNSLAASLNDAANSLAQTSIASPPRLANGHSNLFDIENTDPATANVTIDQIEVQAAEIEVQPPEIDVREEEASNCKDQIAQAEIVTQQPFCQNLELLSQDTAKSETINATQT